MGRRLLRLVRSPAELKPLGTAFSRPNHKLINHQFPTKENPAIVAVNLNAASAPLLSVMYPILRLPSHAAIEQSMYGLFIILVIQILSRVASRFKFFGWWMIVAFLWASAIAWQLPPPHRGSHEFEDVVTEISPEQYCAKAPLEKRDECLRVAKSVDRILGPLRLLRLKGAAHYTSTEKLELMLGPPLGLLVFGFAVALIAKRVRGTPSVAVLTISAISLMIVSFFFATALLTVF